jgi:DNA-binding MarR family transcriptional regulator
MDCHDPRVEAWRAVVTSHAAATLRVQHALAAADLPPLSWFEVLLAVRATPDGRPRMSELADRLTLSRGGITKLVDRLVDAGYLERVSCPDDRRALQAALTPAGECILADMEAVYVDELSGLLGALSTEEAETIAAGLEKVTAATCPSGVLATPMA